MSATLGQLNALWNQAVTIWLSGGWGMLALAVNAVVMFMLGMHVLLKLSKKGYRSVPEKTWRRWIDDPSERKGPIGRLLDFVTGASSLEQSAVFFEELQTHRGRSVRARPARDEDLCRALPLCWDCSVRSLECWRPSALWRPAPGVRKPWASWLKESRRRWSRRKRA